MLPRRDQQVVHFVRVVVRGRVYHLRAKQLLDIGLGGVLCAPDRALNIGELVLLLLHLLNLHLLNVLSDLLGQQVSQLVPDLMPGVKSLRQLIRIVTLADEDVLASAFADLNSQSQDLLLLARWRGAAGSGRSLCRWTLLVLSLQLLLLQKQRLLLLLRQALEVVVLQVVQVAGQAEGLKELLLEPAVVMVLRPVQLVSVRAPRLVSVLLRGTNTVTNISANRHLMGYMAANTGIVIRFSLFKASLMTFPRLANMSIRRCSLLPDVWLTKGQLLVPWHVVVEGRLGLPSSGSKVGGASVHAALRHLLL